MLEINQPIIYLLFILWAVEKCFEYDVWFQVVKDLIVTEIAVLGQVEDGSFLLDLIILIVVHFNQSLPDKVHFLYIALVADHTFAWGWDSAVHLDNEFVREATLTFLEKMVEGSLEFFKYTSVLDEICLHFWSNLLIELEFFNN